MDWSTPSVWGDVVRANAAAHPHKPAFVFGGRSVSFGQFKERSDRLNNALRELGLTRGDRVAILSRNRPEFVEAYGVSTSGLIAVPLNWRLSPRELLHPLNDSGAALVLAEPEFVPVLDRLRGELAHVGHWITFGPAHGEWLGYEELLAQASPREKRADVRPEDVLCIMYTSGTTGVPKGAMHSHQALIRNCRAAAQDLLDLRAEDVSLAVMPLFHVGGMWYHLAPSFASGCTTVMQAEFEPRAVLGALQRHRISNVHLVPTMIRALIEQPAAVACEKLRLIYYAASSIPVELLRQALEYFSGSGFVQSYGSTEAGIITCLSAQDHARALRDPGSSDLLASCGRPLPGVEVAIVDPAGRALPPGEIGEIAVRGERTMTGYWHNDAREATVGGRLATGDLGRVDAAGYLSIVERKHDMIVTGGENVYPGEVESVLHQDAEVLEAAVFGVPDPKWVEKVAAAVVLRPGSSATAQDIIERAHARLAGYKCPKSVVFTEKLPRNATGKVLRSELRRRYAYAAPASDHP